MSKKKRAPFTMATKNEDLELEPFSMGTSEEVILSVGLAAIAIVLFTAYMDGRIF